MPVACEVGSSFLLRRSLDPCMSWGPTMRNVSVGNQTRCTVWVYGAMRALSQLATVIIVATGGASQHI